MSMGTPTGILPSGFQRGPMQGINIIGEVTEALHRFVLDGWNFDGPPPRIEEDLSFVPKDREEVLYIYMYKVNQNTSLMNSKRWRPAKVSVFGPANTEEVYYERAPIYLQLYYLVCVHSKFRSDAERLMGWTLMRLWDATHLVYRPRRYILPNEVEVDSTGQPWRADADGEDVIMEKVAVALVDDLTIGDAVNFYTINEAPFRPYLTYRASCALEGYLVSGPPTTVKHHRSEMMHDPRNHPHERPSGRLGGFRPTSGPKGQIGPPGHGHRRMTDDTNDDSED